MHKFTKYGHVPFENHSFMNLLIYKDFRRVHNNSV